MITACRSCGSADLHIVLDLGLHPIANALVTDPGAPEDKYPLELAFCGACAMLQVTETVPPAILYQRDYPYFTSTSFPVLKHAAEHVEELIWKYELGPRSRVIEIASNDGYLLRNFVQRGIPCVGIDPAEGPADAARDAGVPTICDFFGLRLATELARNDMLADVVIANNVAAHVADINDFIEGIARLLKPEGIAVFEFAYAVDMISHCEFDTIYHEHVFYHSLQSFSKLLRRHFLSVSDVEHLSIHGGSLRVTATPTPVVMSSRARAIYNAERASGIHKLPYYHDFGNRVAELRRDLTALLFAEKIKGKRLACYGAAAKGSTLLNALGLAAGVFEFAIDATSAKQGKYTPGQHIPIVHPDHLLAAQPDAVLLLAWNFADEILVKEAAYRERGGQFIIPIPTPRVVH